MWQRHWKRQNEYKEANQKNFLESDASVKFPIR